MPADKALFIGADPGLTGALAVIDQDSRPIVVIDIGTRPREISKTVIKKEFDARSTRDRITYRLVHYTGHEWHGWIEMPFSIPARPDNPSSGSKMMSMNSLFQTYGGILAMLDLMEVETHTVRPAEWKARMGITKQKDYSLGVARQLWPTIRLNLKKHHNRAEALLIAEYGRLLWKNERRYGEKP